MSLLALRKGASVRIDEHEFVLHQRLSDSNWQLQDAVTGEWRTFTEDDLLDRYARKELSFVVRRSGEHPLPKKLSEKLARDLAAYSPQLIAIARNRVQYLKEIDRRQPIVLQPKTIQPLIKSVSERIRDPNPPGWCTVYRDYRKWLSAARDVRAIILRYADRGRRGTRLPPEVTITADQVIEELYLTPERKRVPEVARAGLIRCVRGPEQNFPRGFHFHREDIAKIQNAFARYAIPVREYAKAGELITLHDAVHNYLGNDSGLVAVIGAVANGTLIPSARNERFGGIMGYLFLSKSLRKYCPRLRTTRRIAKLQRNCISVAYERHSCQASCSVWYSQQSQGIQISLFEARSGPRGSTIR